jgi:hypothetical protein
MKWLFALLAVVAGFSIQAHQCGPGLIEVMVGQTCPWRITADRFEVSSRYTPVLSGPEGIATTFPQKQFLAKHGDFLITGISPGTNFLDVDWFYSGTGAGNHCRVMIVVKASDGSTNLDTHQREGTLSSYSGGQSIHALWLKQLLDTNIPPDAAKLMIFTQCYGGNIAFSSYFRDAANTAIASATSPNQTGKYGGYHDDAAKALSPGEGKTAFDVHEAATEGRTALEPNDLGGEPSKTNLFLNSEWPRIAGGLNLADFSLQSTASNGPVKSRHIVIYMGSPEAKNIAIQQHGSVSIPSKIGTNAVVDDVDDAIRIFNNFKNEPNTTLHTAGGRPVATNSVFGTNGWQYRGDYWGLARAIQDAGTAIKNSPNPAAEQFILFVGDHGGQGADAAMASPAVAAPMSKTGLTTNFKPLGLNDPQLGQLFEEIENQPGFNVGFGGNPLPPPGNPSPFALIAGRVQPFLAPGSLVLEITNKTGQKLVLTNFTVEARDLDGNGIVGDSPNEEYQVFFPMEKTLLAGPFGHDLLDITLENKSENTLVVTRLSQDSGLVKRLDNSVPIPRFVGVTRQGSNVDALVRSEPGYFFNLETSSNLKSWSFVRTVLLLNEEETISVPRNLAFPAEFFRLRWSNIGE